MKDESEIQVIWFDDSLLVVNKPAGILSIPDGYDPDVPHLKSLLAPEYGNLWIVHRLDRNTSGVILLARSASAHRQLNIQFQERQVKKIYHALVRGNPNWEHRTVDLPLSVNTGRRHRTVVDHQRGKSSVTVFKVLERFGSHCLVEASPHSGRRHQIRAHLAEQGLAIVGDDLYGNGHPLNKSDPDNFVEVFTKSKNPLLNRVGLHARSIKVVHPKSHQVTVFKAPYPDDFRRALSRLRDMPD